MKLITGKTSAIALRTIEVTNTSAIVVWLSRGHGRLATMIKGAYRPKSLFLGQFDLFYTCELVYYLHAREHLHAIRECFPLKTRANLRLDWRACAMASYLCDLLGRVTPWEARHPDLYDLLDEQLDLLDEHGFRQESIFQFELKLLDALGVAPRLNNCAACSGPGSGLGNRTVFSNDGGGILCGGCAGRDSSAETAISNGTLAILKSWQRFDSDAGRRTQATAAQNAEIRRILGSFIAYQTETDPAPRSIAFETAIDASPFDRPSRSRASGGLSLAFTHK